MRFFISNRHWIVVRIYLVQDSEGFYVTFSHREVKGARLCFVGWVECMLLLLIAENIIITVY